MTTNSETGRLEVHVLGAGKGESIVLKLPGGKYGVVDCYSESLKDAAGNPTLDFLTRRDVGELEFVCLTHPHNDHYRGMSQLLESFTVRQFWRFGGLSGEHFSSLVQYFAVEAERADHAAEIENATEFFRVFELVRKKRIPETHVVSRQQLYPEPHDPQAPLQIWGITPSGRQLSRYQQQFAQCFDSGGRLKTRLPYRKHNMISAALAVEFGDTRVILGADTERSAWQDALKQFSAASLAASAVKVSHHGSTNGYATDLWPSFASGKKPVAIIAPYLQFRLPAQETLDHIQLYAASILVTCLPAMDERLLTSETASGALLRSRVPLFEALDLRAEPASANCGRCTLVFDNHGQCVHREIRPPAETIWP